MKKSLPAASHDQVLREHLVALLRGGHAHITFEQAVAGLAPADQGRTVPGLPHSPWSLLEHLRIAQWDILEFSLSAQHKSPPWPAGYWPKTPTPPSKTAWKKSVKAFQADLNALCELLSDVRQDLYTPLPWGDGQTLLREALLVADHNSYHLGQLLAVRRCLGAWKD